GGRGTVLQRADRMLTRFDPELVGSLMEKFAEIGVDVRTGTVVERVERTDSGFRTHARVGGQALAVDADLVVHAAGRVADLDSLDLSAGSVETQNHRIVLNDLLQN